MLRQFNNISSWRQHVLTIEPHEVYTLNFRDTLPNIFVLHNPNMSTLKIGISSIPRSDAYEFKIEYNTTETFGRPIGTNNIYILNDSSVPVKVTGFSIEKEFDPALLKNMNVALDGYTIVSSSEISGVKDGVLLPVELSNDIDNSIKNMYTLLNGFDNETYPEILTKLQALIEKPLTFTGDGITLQGVQTDLTGVISKMTDIISKLGGIGSLVKPSDLTDLSNNVSSSLNKLTSISSGLDKLNGFYTTKTSAVYLNKTDNFEYVANNKERVHFGWFMNDGEDCEITLNGTSIFTVYAGEQFSDFEIELNVNDVVRITGENISCRIKYWVY